MLLMTAFLSTADKQKEVKDEDIHANYERSE